MEKRKFNLLQIFLLKDIVFWKRTWTMHTKFEWLGKLTIFPIALSIIGISHYAFAGMHFLFESLLWALRSEQYKLNMNKFQKQLSLV